MQLRKKKSSNKEVTVMAEYEDFLDDISQDDISHDDISPDAMSQEKTHDNMPQVKNPIVNTAMATHIGTREYQQDAAYVCEPVYADSEDSEKKLAYGILCDGMGGTAEGERASTETILQVARKIASAKEEDETVLAGQHQNYFPAFLENCAYAANELILNQNEELQQSSGTTLLTVILFDNNLYWLSVGDSRIYIIRGSEIVQTTKDHNYALELQEKVDAGLLSQEEADNDPKKEHLISYIGAPYLERIDVNRSPFQMQHGDIVLLCSDGLVKSLFDDEILEIITRCGSNIFEAARLLPVEAFDRSPGALDNTTVVLMQYLG